MHGEPKRPMGARGRACWEPGWARRAVAAVAGGARWDRLWAAAVAGVVAEAVGPGPGPGRLRGPKIARRRRFAVRFCRELEP